MAALTAYILALRMFDGTATMAKIKEENGEDL